MRGRSPQQDKVGNGRLEGGENVGPRDGADAVEGKRHGQLLARPNVRPQTLDDGRREIRAIEHNNGRVCVALAVRRAPVPSYRELFAKLRRRDKIEDFRESDGRNLVPKQIYHHKLVHIFFSVIAGELFGVFCAVSKSLQLQEPKAARIFESSKSTRASSSSLLRPRLLQLSKVRNIS